MHLYRHLYDDPREEREVDNPKVTQAVLLEWHGAFIRAGFEISVPSYQDVDPQQ